MSFCFALLFLSSSLSAAGLVGSGVYEKLALDGQALVIVAFGLPLGEPPLTGGQIADIQQQILSEVSSEDFRPIFLWRLVPGMAGVVTPNGLTAILRNRYVTRVDADVPGEGHDVQSNALIKSDVVQSRGIEGRGITVALLDTGVNSSHPDLAGSLIDQHCFCIRADMTGCCPGGAFEQYGTGSALDDNGHGTNVAGIILSAGASSPKGVAPASQIVAVKVMDNMNEFSSTAQVIAGLDWILAIHPEVSVVNMSLGTSQLFVGSCDTDPNGSALKAAVDALAARGITVIASTGNQGSATQMASPACLSSVIGVGAVYDANVGSFTYPGICTDTSTVPNKVACFSNGGTALGVLAPGAIITTTALAGGATNFYGTSAAAPHVTGVTAALRQTDRYLTGVNVKTVLQTTGVVVIDPRPPNLSYKRIDALAATNSRPFNVSGSKPNAGPRAGGTAIDIYGSGFAAGATVSVVGKVAASVSVNSPNWIRATLGSNQSSGGSVGNVVVTKPGMLTAQLIEGFVLDFLDVPPSHPVHDSVIAVARSRVTAGCGGGNYCPALAVSRAQMAVLLLKAEHGSAYVPPPATGTVFNDVPANAFAAAWIEQLQREGITTGCGGGNYCPNAAVTRAAMAVFLLKTKYESSYSPPAATGIFDDVPIADPNARWIEELFKQGVTAGCSDDPPLYCPSQSVDRGSMAVFLTKTFRFVDAGPWEGIR